MARTYVTDHGTLQTNLISWWTLNEESAGSAPVGRADSLGTWDLTDYNTVPSTDGIVEGEFAANVTGTNSEGLHTASDFTALTASFSINIWLKTTFNSSGTAVVMGINDGSNALFQLINVSAGNYGFWVSTSVTTYISSTIPEASVQDGAWHMLTGVYDESTNDLRLYLDGSQVGTDTTTSGTLVGSIGSQDRLMLGARYGNGTPALFWTGAMSDAAIWTKALSGSEITDLWNSGEGMTYTGSGGAGSGAYAGNLNLLGVG